MPWKGRKPEGLFFALSCVALAVCLASPARAHRIEVHARTEGKRVHIEAYFFGGKRAGGAKVKVYGAAKEPVVEGVTDTAGRFSFDVSKPGDLRIAVSDGAGHRGTALLNKEDFSLPRGEPATSLREQTMGTDGISYESGADNGESKMRAVASDEALERMIEQKMEPIRQELRELRKKVDRPPVRGILAGIGYILGIAGILFFVFGRKKEERN
ncbi:MAG: carboxypeptidase-like regulatory domain-containing protein [Deltaproteobacteria bacterium]|nr:carboxypeptidase-like regulatory domain-containing protein [Deltaproteobacteria bacterium]